MADEKWIGCDYVKLDSDTKLVTQLETNMGNAKNRMISLEAYVFSAKTFEKFLKTAEALLRKSRQAKKREQESGLLRLAITRFSDIILRFQTHLRIRFPRNISANRPLQAEKDT